MSGGTNQIPNTGTLSGLDVVNDANTALANAATLTQGGTAPTTASTGLSSMGGFVWHDTTNYLIKLRDQADTTWIPTGAIDETNKLFTPYFQGQPVNSVFGGGLRNKLIGGDFSSNPWQRGTSFAGTSTQYGPDRWQLARVSGVSGMTVSRVTNSGADAPQFYYACRIQRAASDTATNALHLAYSMESQSCYPLVGKTITLALRGKKGANLSGTCTLTLYYGTGADQNVLSGFTGATSLGSIDLTQFSTTGSVLTLSAAVPSNATQLGLLYTHTPSGTAGAADYVDLEIIQLEDSPVFTSFERRLSALELHLCRRYYEVGSNGITAAGNGANILNVSVAFKASKRVAPSILRTGNYLSSAEAGTTTGTATTDGFYFSNTGTGVGGSWTASAEL